MRRLILLGLALALVLCACQNSLEIKDTELDGVNNPAYLNHALLKTGDSYAVGYGNGNIRSDRIYFNWTPCTDANFLCYKLERNGSVRKTILNPLITSVIDSSLTQDWIYDYRLICILKNGMAVEDTIELKTPQFLPPNQLDFETLSVTSIRLTWNNRAETATSYEIERYNANTDVTTTYETTTEVFTNTGLVEGEQYRYRVRAVNAYENTDWSYWLHTSVTTFFDFEADDGGFASNSAYGWQHGQPSYMAAYSGVNVWATGLDGSYDNNANYMLESPYINIGAEDVLEFYHYYATEGYYDGGNVKISIDGGTSWQLIYPIYGYPYDYIYSSGESGYSGSGGYWMQAVFNLSAYAGHQAKFRWQFTSDSSVPSIGWYIDDVRVGLETDKELTR